MLSLLEPIRRILSPVNVEKFICIIRRQTNENKILSIYGQKSTRSRAYSTSSTSESSTLFERGVFFALADILRFVDDFPSWVHTVDFRPLFRAVVKFFSTNRLLKKRKAYWR